MLFAYRLRGYLQKCRDKQKNPHNKTAVSRGDLCFVGKAGSGSLHLDALVVLLCSMESKELDLVILLKSEGLILGWCIPV